MNLFFLIRAYLPRVLNYMDSVQIQGANTLQKMDLYETRRLLRGHRKFYWYRS